MAPSDRLKRRAEFLAIAATGLRCATPSVVAQARAHGEARASRFGFTATRKIGNAVIRNRARRRLKEAVRKVSTTHAAPSHDYVLVARQDTTRRNWVLLLDDVARALQRAPLQRSSRR